MILTFMRHLPIDAGMEQCIGQTNVELSPDGLTALVSLAKEACRLRPDKIFCSDLQRCHLLAEAIAARLGLFAEPDPIWREVSFGTWENRTWDDIQAREPQVLSEWIANFDTVVPPAGESFEQLQARVLTGVECKIVGPTCDAGVTSVPRSSLNTGETPMLQYPPFAAYPFGRHLSWRCHTAVIPAFVGGKTTGARLMLSPAGEPFHERALAVNSFLRFVLGDSRSGKSRLF